MANCRTRTKFRFGLMSNLEEWLSSILFSPTQVQNRLQGKDPGAGQGAVQTSDKKSGTEARGSVGQAPKILPLNSHTAVTPQQLALQGNPERAELSIRVSLHRLPSQVNADHLPEKA